MNRFCSLVLVSTLFISGAATNGGCAAPTPEEREPVATSSAGIERGVAVHRVVNSYAGNVMLTSDKALIAHSIDAYGSHDGGVAFGAATGNAGVKYLYRSVNPTTYDMFYSSSLAELDSLRALGYDQAEIALLVYEQEEPGTVTLHRASHYFEGKWMHDYFTGAVPAGWNDEGVIGWVGDPVYYGGEPSGHVIPRASTFTVMVDGVTMSTGRYEIGHDVVEGRIRDFIYFYFKGPDLWEGSRIVVTTEKTHRGCEDMFQSLQYQPEDGSYRTFFSNPYTGDCGLDVTHDGLWVHGSFAGQVTTQAGDMSSRWVVVAFDIAR